MKNVIVVLLVAVVTLGAGFFLGSRWQGAVDRQMLRQGADRIINVPEGTLVLGGKLDGWGVGDFQNGEKVGDLVFDKFAKAYHADPDGSRIGHFTVSHGYLETDSGLQPVLGFLMPPVADVGCEGAEACEELTKKEILVSWVPVPRLLFCPPPPMTYKEAKTKLFDQTATTAATRLIEHDRTALVATRSQ